MSEETKKYSRYTAVINGKEYNLLSEKPEEFLKTIVDYTKLRLDEVSQRPSGLLGTPVANAIVAALNIAEDYIDLKSEYEKIKAENDRIKTEMFRHNNAIKENERLIESLKQENAKLKNGFNSGYKNGFKGGAQQRPKGQY